MFRKGLRYLIKELSISMKLPGVIHPTGQLLMALHLIGYGSLPILCSVVYLSLNPWEVPGWQVIAVDADVKPVITSWLQRLHNIFFTLENKPCGRNAEMVAVATMRSVVYHLFHSATYWSKSQQHSDIERLFPYLLNVLCEYIAFWAGKFIRTGCSEWWGFCVICWNFLQ
jgi:hypothetical protein